MRYASDHNDTTRQRILDAASRLFREHGIAAVGLAKIMAEVDLTVGTFYTHFKSKEALVQETLVRALNDRHQFVLNALEHADFDTLVRAYLSPEHRDGPGTGCTVAALAAEVARHPDDTRQAFSTGNAVTLDELSKRLSTERKMSRADTAAVFGLLVGTLQLARATPDRAESDAILEAGIRAVHRLVA